MRGRERGERGREREGGREKGERGERGGGGRRRERGREGYVKERSMESI